MVELARRHAHAHPPAGARGLRGLVGPAGCARPAAPTRRARSSRRSRCSAGRAWVPRGLEPAPPHVRLLPRSTASCSATATARSSCAPSTTAPCGPAAASCARPCSSTGTSRAPGARARQAGGHAVRPAGARRGRRGRRRRAVQRGVKVRDRGPIVSCGGHEDAHHGGRVPRDGEDPGAAGVELIDGEIVVNEPTRWHQDAVKEMVMALGMWEKGGADRGVASSPLDIKLDEFKSTAGRPLVRRGPRAGDHGSTSLPAPDLVVEIRSPSTWRTTSGARSRATRRPESASCGSSTSPPARLPPLRSEAPGLRRHARADAEESSPPRCCRASRSPSPASTRSGAARAPAHA